MWSDAESAARGAPITPFKAPHWCSSHVRVGPVPWCLLCGGGPRNGARRGERCNETITSPRLHIPLPDQARRLCHCCGEQRRDRNVATS